MIHKFFANICKITLVSKHDFGYYWVLNPIFLAEKVYKFKKNAYVCEIWILE